MPMNPTRSVCPGLPESGRRLAFPPDTEDSARSALLKMRAFSTRIQRFGPLSKALIYASRAQEGIENLYTAMELEPENPPEYLVWLGMGRFFSESFEQAALTLERASKLLPEDINTHLLLVATYGYLGRLADADRTLTKLIKIQVKSGSATSRFNLDSWPLKEDDDRERLREGIRLAGVSG